MCQVLFTIPLKTSLGFGWDIPIHGYGFMLFLAFIACLILAMRLSRMQKIPVEVVQDLAIWLFIPGIIGARLMFVWTELGYFLQHPLKIFFVWDGGLVFYGSAIGGLVGFVLAYFKLLRPKGISAWKMADVVAPCIVLGLAIGRIGCLLNGCCYGHVATLDTPAVSFPMPTDPRKVLVARGLQTAAGFLVDTATLRVTAVEPDSAADHAGLQKGDQIVAVNGKAVVRYARTSPDEPPQLEDWLTTDWPRGENTLRLTVERAGRQIQLAFRPATLPLYPTQIFETVSAALLVFLLLSYLPFRRRDGELIALLMIGYAVHRFVNEQVRNDTPAYQDGLTLSQNLSIALLLAGIGLLIWLRRQPAQYGPHAAPVLLGPAAAQEGAPEATETALHE